MWIIQGTVATGDDVIWQHTYNKMNFATPEACKEFINSSEALWLSAQHYVQHIAEMFHGSAHFDCIIEGAKQLI